MRAAGALLAGVLALAGCGAQSPDYQSLWTTSATSTTPADQPMPLAKYLDDSHVGREQVAPGALPDLTVSIPTPKGWSKRTNPKLSDLTEVIGKGGKYPTAILTVLRLSGDVDAAEVIKHGVNDAGPAHNFHVLDSSTADFAGFPSGMIQGSHDLGGQRLHSWFRMVVATGSIGQPYLVQLTIIALADQAKADAADVEAIMAGFTVAAK